MKTFTTAYIASFQTILVLLFALKTEIITHLRVEFTKQLKQILGILKGNWYG